MAGAAKKIHRGAVPMDKAIIDAINNLIDDVEAIRAALVTHGSVAHTTVTLPASNLVAGKVED